MASNGVSIEKYLEHNFCKWVESIGGKAVKGPSYQYIGIPDRIVVLPDGGGTLWIEFKGGTAYGLTPKQIEWKERLKNSDPKRYACVETKEGLEKMKKYCLDLINKNNDDTIKATTEDNKNE